MPELHELKDSTEVARAVADFASAALSARVARSGMASLAVSGGRTPTRFFEELSTRDLPWDKIAVTLVDERWVRETSDRSNARLVRQHLLKNKAAAAKFVPLANDAPTPEDGLFAVNEALEDMAWPLACAILGMGDDGHTASFFPNGDHLQEALDPEAPLGLIPMRAPDAGEPRITLTLPVLLAADALALHIEGEAKKPVLEKALGEGPAVDMPIRAVLRAKPALDIFWCP
ncbi:6-phosphogluconolactonase [Ancylobacter dichloromethanicus]|uniref:6-phosphogluconolactonase n=1 Tax=Ancylobacter dichloromethanicus TaxID=518825 RepID=A0A9W6N0K3_9HYPH|nr:6-phosphogluconolactonase [Ancylobacter dichloromethanicus]MBS7553309.1 6-phosphogluconolactonase [Ancylobacter dichloromethanicus]GLK73092.1 6-phosphogluconolactonase [Ancylobacter dichloromethanicus]